MSLPQRKKSAEEIAKLRESLGIPGQPPIKETSPAEAPPPEPVPEPEKAAEKPESVAKTESVTKPEPALKEDAALPAESASAPVEMLPATPTLEPFPAVEPPAPKIVRSLRRSERIPVLPVEDEKSEKSPALREGSILPGKTVLPALQVAKPVRSLRKSEQIPVTELPEPSPDSKLPVHRHSDQELGEIRRQEAIAALSPQGPPKPMVAHLAVVIPGYIAAIAGGICFHYYELSISVTGACVGIALLVAAFIFIKRPLSRHHAAFIAVMTLFVIVFGALYYFPQLQHGT